VTRISRVNTRSRASNKAQSSANSVFVKGTVFPSMAARNRTRLCDSGPATISGSLPKRPLALRSKLPTRATSSRGEKGLTT
jgi:hypothetical protein